MTTRLYLIRHAETEITTEDRFAGEADVELAPEGREHAEELGTRLTGFQIDAVYSSPLRRAVQTAEQVAQPHGKQVCTVADLRELKHGHWEGMTRAEVETKYPEEYAAYEADPFDYGPPGGESARAVLDRALPAALQIIRDHDGGEIALVSHKTTNRLLICYFLGIDLRRYRDKIAQRPTCLNVLDFTGETQVKLSLLNDISHYEICAPPDSPFVV